MKNLALENEIRNIEFQIKEILEAKQKLNEQIQTHKETLASLSEEIKFKQQQYNSTKESLRSSDLTIKFFDNCIETHRLKLVQLKLNLADLILKGE
jgi:chromosome segregation ATPase